MTCEKRTIYCADIGSVANNRFGWVRLAGDQSHKDNCIVAFVENIACAIAKGRMVALGFECPLWIPVPPEPQRLTKGCRVDGNRPWSAGAGTAVLATGLTQVAWILDKLRLRLKKRGTALPSAHLAWPEFWVAGGSALFFWEAFVTGEAKVGSEDAGDALVACRAFADRLPNLAGNAAQSPHHRFDR